MHKSNKRMKLEQEIFSTSIQDIEQMFAGTWADVDQDQTNVKPRKVNSCYASEQALESFTRERIILEPKLLKNTINHPINVSAQHNRSQEELKLPIHGISKLDNLNRLDLPAGTCLHDTRFDYDCINMSFFSEAQSEDTAYHSAFQAPPSSAIVTADVDYVVLSQNVLFNLNEELLDDYTFELDLKLYLPRVNLESDLKMIDFLITRPVSVAN